MYKIYSSNSVEQLRNPELLCKCETTKEIITFITGVAKEPYVRYLLFPEYTMVDYGSWSKFLAIIPPVGPNELYDANSI